jgi:pimeloyl-ACP methyl ester carboxylesterase
MFETKSSLSSAEKILWVHGYSMNCRLWSELWSHLPEFSHIGVDLPGHGRSEPWVDASLSDLGRALAEIATSQGVTHVVGLSLGSSVALQMAMELPRQFKTLTLSAPTVIGLSEEPTVRALYRQLFIIRALGADNSVLADLWLSETNPIFAYARKNASLWRRIVQAIKEHSWTELNNKSIATVACQSQVAEVSRIAAISLSCTLLIGDADLQPQLDAADFLRSKMRGCSVLSIPKAGHLALLENVSLTSEILRDIISSN